MKSASHMLTSGLLLAITFTACSPTRFSQYSGSPRVWPVSQESMAETSFRLPVYRTWPDKPYEIIGSVRFEDPRREWDDGVINAVVSKAKSKHGDAIIIRYGSEFGVGGYVGMGEDTSVWSGNQITALVIKWKSKKALEAEAAATRTFRDGFQAKFPELAQNASLFNSAIDYIQRMGLSLDSESATERLKGILSEIHDSKEGELNGKWLYRCGFTRSRLTSSFSDYFYGVAQVTLKENVLTVVSTSTSRGAEVTFSGAFDKGRVTGKMGIAATSVNCDGVAANEKISLSGQGQVADGTFQASLVFLR